MSTETINTDDWSIKDTVYKKGIGMNEYNLHLILIYALQFI